MPAKFPVWDNHFHLDPAGPWEQSLKDFVHAGGTHVVVVHKPYFEGEGRLNRSVEDHRRQFEITLSMAQKAREAGVRALVALAPHPAEFTKLLEAGVPIEEAAAVQRVANELAAQYVREGKAHAMGEVGRPHWTPVPPDVWAKANELMEHSFQLARDVGCPVQIHAETATPESFASLATHLRAAGLPVDRAMKHYSTPIVDVALNHGLWPSVLIGKGSAEEALRRTNEGTAPTGGRAAPRFVMETDYMCDPRYPGAVLGPKTVPRRTNELIQKGLMTEEAAWTIHARNPKAIYGVDVEI